jgi:hypothetical protein
MWHHSQRHNQLSGIQAPILRAAPVAPKHGTAGTPFHIEPGGIVSPFISSDTSPRAAPSPMQQPGNTQEPQPIVTPEPTTTSWNFRQRCSTVCAWMNVISSITVPSPIVKQSGS